MPHHPCPFFPTARKAWFVQVGDRQINLGTDKNEAFTRYHELMARPVVPLVTQLEAQKLVVVIVDEFLDWCEKHRATHTYRWYIEGSPLTHMKKPGCGRKEQVVTPEQYQALLDRYKDQEFKDLLFTTWETGCRPQESLRVEARHVDLASHRWVFPASESKGKKIPRIVYLTPKALEITRRLVEKHPTGALFRNTDGVAWTPYATNCRLQTVRRKTGVKYSLYALRHSFATHALMNGVDCITVSTLMGHSDPSTLAKTYQHISQSPTYMSEQLRKAVG